MANWLMGALILVSLLLLQKKKKYNVEDEVRKAESPIEEIMIRALHKEGYSPIAQVPCKGYRIDVSLYYKGRKIAIECDGKAFHSSNKQLRHDDRKDAVLKKEKWIVLRFTGSEINRNIDECIRKINLFTKKRA